MLGGDGKVADAVEWSIGVDFGTAFSKAAATRMTHDLGAPTREIRPLRIGAAAGWNKPFLTPSSMFLDRERLHFGPWAASRLAQANLDERELLRSFKTILGANDFEGALDYYPRPCIDPDRLFRLRDLIVLYLAYLLALVDAAARQSFGDSAGIVAAGKLRFSRPGWMPGRIAAAHEVMASLFTQGQHVHLALGEQLLSPEGLPYATARAALDAARAEPGHFPSLDGGIYEASAVGLCHFSDPGAPNCLLIVDVGGGTTDVAGLVREPFSDDIRVVRTARNTIDVAGDDFDAVLLDLFLAKGRKFKSVADRNALWRSIVPHVRELKEELFARGAVEFRFRDTILKCSARELENQPAFKEVLGEIRRLFETSLTEVVRTSRRDRSGKIGVVLAGGGANMPAIRAMVSKARPRLLGLKIEVLPATPNWAHQLSSVKEFEALFGQLSAAFGAAISRPVAAGAIAA